ncbi:MAG: transporter substrate-binding domain-containing protein, partial [Colwellia sp.]|nr:transporter substrate-binding domain-containing protein [Colwellia sp.]
MSRLYWLLIVFISFLSIAQANDINTVALSADEQRWLANNAIINVAGGNEWAPIDFVNSKGKYDGFAYDYLKLISEKTGLTFNFKSSSWTKAYNSVLNKENILLPALYQTTERDKHLIFSEAYYRSLDYFFTRDDVDFNRSNEFQGKKLALVKDYATGPLLQKSYPNLTIIYTESLEQAITLLLEKKVDLIFDSYVTIQYLMKKRAIVNFVPYKSLENMDVFPLKMATTKNNPELISIINKGMKVISEEERQALLTKWGISTNLFPSQKRASQQLNLSTQQIQWIKDHPTIRVAADVSWLPFDFVDENNVHDGLSHDILEYISSVTGLDFVYVPNIWLNSLNHVKNKQLDLLPAIYKSPQRSKELLFSKPYFQPLSYFFVHEDSTLTPSSDLNGMRLAAVAGNASAQEVMKEYPQIDIVYVKSVADAVQLLSQKKVDLIADALSVVNYNLVEQGVTDIKKLTPISGASTKGLRIAVRDDYQNLIPIIDLALDSLSEFTKEQLFRKWSVQPSIRSSNGLAFTANEQDWLAQYKQLNIAVDPNWMPYESIDINGKHVGIVSEFVELISKKLQIQFNVIKTKDWQESTAQFNSKKADIISSSIEFNHFDNAIFSHEYLSSPFAIVMRDENQYIENLSQVIGKKITLVEGYSSTEQIMKQYPQQKFNLVPTIAHGLEDLYTGHTDVLIGILIQVNYHIIENGFDNLRVVGKTAHKIHLGFAVQPEFSPLIPIINKTLANISTEQKQAILNRWGQNEILVKTDYKLIFIISFSALLIFLIFIYWNRRLQKEVVLRAEIEQNLSVVIANMPVIVFVTEKATTNLLMANPTATKALDINSNDINEIKGTDFYHWEQAQKTIDNIVNKFKENDHFSNELIKLKTLNGKTIEGLLSISPIRFQRKDAYLNIVVDLNERIEMEKQLTLAKNSAEIANKAKSEFLANMSHEIRTPMNAIIGFTELLYEQVKDDKLKSFVKTIKSAGNSLLLLINDILDLSKIEAGKTTIDKKVIDPHQLFDDIGNVFMMNVREKDLDFILDIDPDIPSSLLLDSARIRQVLFNLVGNAVKFTDKGYIKLKATAENENAIHSSVDLRIDVIDTGIGISEHEISNIFENFHQQEGQSVRKYGGTGLGLTISKRLTELMNGTLTVTSKLNQGSCFSVTLKAIEIASISAPKENIIVQKINSPISFPNCHVLIVDDIKDNRELLYEIITDLKASSKSAVNGEEAVDFASNEHFDLVIMDIRMPIMDGYQAAQKIKEFNPELPIVALTASVMRDDYELQRKENFNGYLRKPVLKRELINELRKHLPYEYENENLLDNDGEFRQICINSELNLLLKNDYLTLCLALQK